MKIAQVPPLIEPVPPLLYGGTERAVGYLTEELIRCGHDVTLFATGDSVTTAELVVCAPHGLRLAGCSQPEIDEHYERQFEMLAERFDEFDVVHFHTDVKFPYLRTANSLSTLHGRLDIDAYLAVLRQGAAAPLVSISHNQRRPYPRGNWIGNIGHGLPANLYAAGKPSSDRYLAFLGRICPEKGIERAIEISKRTGIPLRIAAKVDRYDREYFDRVISPLIDGKMVTYIGEVTDRDKQDFLSGAMAVLFPIAWPEPFGLVMIEAMAVSTPVIAWPLGAVPEIIDDGLTGFMVESIDAAVDAVGRIGELDRASIRWTFEERFTIAREARDYVDLYKKCASQ
jgi:glycosyltransferase involved in cell wall biosynthesis